MSIQVYARFLKLPAARRQWKLIQSYRGVAFGGLQDQVEAWLEINDFDQDPSAIHEQKWGPSHYLEARALCLEALDQSSVLPALTTPDARARFDRTLSEVILSAFPFSPYEAAKIETWRYVALKVIPELTVNRFPWKAEGDVFVHGGNEHSLVLGRVDRNVIGRLWIRQDYVRNNPSVLAGLTADNLAGFFERPSLFSNPLVGVQLLELISALSSNSELGIPNKEDLIRDIFKRVVRVMAVRDFDAMPRDQVRQHLLAELEASVSSFNGKPVKATYDDSIE